MAEDNSRHIPTLEDVVEIGEAFAAEDNETEHIRIVADAAIDDPYDDEFRQLFEHATDTELSHDNPAQLRIDELDTAHSSRDAARAEDTGSAATQNAPPDTRSSDATLPDDAAENDATGQLQFDQTAGTDMPAEQPAAAADTGPLYAIEPESTDDDSADTDDDTLWLSDWQEDSHAHDLMDDNDHLDMLHSRAEIEITDPQNDALIRDAVAQDSASAPSPEPPAEQTTADASPEVNQADAGVSINTAALVDEIVSELLPEIEWKLRTRIRDVLEQHFPPEDS